MNKIQRLKQVVFEDDECNLSAFNKYMNKGDYNKARMITEAMVVTQPDLYEAVELDTILTDLCMEQEDYGQR